MIRIQKLKQRQAYTWENRKYQCFTSLLASLLPNGTLPPVASCNIYEPSSKPSPRRLNKVNRARTYLRHLPMKVCKLRPNPTLRAEFYCRSAACKPNGELYVITFSLWTRKVGCTTCFWKWNYSGSFCSLFLITYFSTFFGHSLLPLWIEQFF